MKKYTLLEMTQSILSSLDGDEVNDIDDTVESQQVVNIIETVYHDLMARLDLSEDFDLFRLEGLGDTSRPVVMTVPSTVDEVLWIKYNKIQSGDTDPVWDAVEYLTPDEFLKLSNSLNLSDNNVISFYPKSDTSISLLCYNDKAPQYYTSFDDGRIVFDSYDSDVDSSLQASKTQCYGTVLSTFTRSNGFIFPIDANAHTLLLNEAKAIAFAELKQISNDMASKSARRGMIHLQKTKENVRGLTYFDSLPNYGRK